MHTDCLAPASPGTKSVPSPSQSTSISTPLHKSPRGLISPVSGPIGLFSYISHTPLQASCTQTELNFILEQVRQSSHPVVNNRRILCKQLEYVHDSHDNIRKWAEAEAAEERSIAEAEKKVQDMLQLFQRHNII